MLFTVLTKSDALLFGGSANIFFSTLSLSSLSNTFEQLIQVTPLDKVHRQSLSIYHLMYEGLETLSGSKTQKLAKKYLSGDRMDLVLWNGFAQAEKSQGRIPEVQS